MQTTARATAESQAIESQTTDAPQGTKVVGISQGLVILARTTATEKEMTAAGYTWRASWPGTTGTSSGSQTCAGWRR